MFTSFTLHTALGKGILGGCLLLVSGHPCCLGQLLDLWLINSELVSLLFSESSLSFAECALLGFISGVEGGHV